MISSFTERFAVRTALPVRALRCQNGFACQTDFVVCVTGGGC